MSDVSPWVVRAAEPNERTAALELLLAADLEGLDQAARAARIAEMLRQAERGQISLEHLLVATSTQVPARLLGATLLSPQPDGIALVWLPGVVASPSDLPVAGAPLAPSVSLPAWRAELARRLFAEVNARLDRLDVVAGQLLLPEGAVWCEAEVDAAGFRDEVRLVFLARSLDEPIEERPGPNSGGTPGRERLATTYRSVTLVEQPEEARWLELLDQTYEGSQDCALLSGWRTARGAWEVHKLCGEFTPDLWRIYEVGEQRGQAVREARGSAQAAGLCLLNDHPEDDAIELVYLGVAPEFRGLGLGAHMLHEALLSSRDCGRRWLCAAVDVSNDYARSLYARAGCFEWGTRRARFRIAQSPAQK